jgi:hypothetical protein
MLTESIIKKRENLSKSVQFQSNKNPEVNKSERLILPKLNSLRRITIDPAIGMVKKLNMNESPKTIFIRKDILDKKKVLIDNNLEIQQKRLGTFKPLSKAEQAQKLESKLTEKELENNFKEKFKKLEKKHEELLLIEKTIERIIKDNDNVKLELDMLENYQNDIDKKLVLEDSDTINPEKKFLKSKALKFEMKMKREEERKRREEMKLKLEKQKEENERALNGLKNDMLRMKEESLKIKEEIYFKRHELNEYYLLQLYEGLDFKSEGLVSFIKSIWNIGLDVDISFMPTYLDRQAVDYLFTKARQLIEISKMRQIIQEAKERFILESSEINILIEDSKNNTNSDSSQFFETRVENEIAKKNNINNKKGSILDYYPKTKNFMEKYDKEHVENAELYTMANVKEKVYSKMKLSPLVLNRYKNIEKLNYLLNQMEAKIRENEKEEVIRISKEFINNDYANKYNVDITTVISALCGEEHKDEELLVYSRMVKENNDKKKMIKYYSTYKNEKI